jgi:hypothetical protein
MPMQSAPPKSTRLPAIVFAITGLVFLGTASAFFNFNRASGAGWPALISGLLCFALAGWWLARKR